MVLRCKTLIFHIFEKMKIVKKLEKIFKKFEKNLKIPRLQLITIKIHIKIFNI